MLITADLLYSQDPYCPTCRKKDAQKPYVDLTLGWVPKPMYNAGKISITGNNLLLKRFGAYTSYEIGLNNDFFSHVIGGTATIYRTVYVFAGLDWYTRFQGVFFKMRGRNYSLPKSMTVARKEIGIGASVFTYGMLHYGYSFQIGHSFTAGVKMPIEKIKRLFYPRV